MTIVDDLVANPGLYIGIDTVADSDLRGAARLIVTVLPGAAGVMLDYEIFNPTTPDRILGHIEHTMIGRTEEGGAIMIIGHTHANSLTILRETEPGTFEPGPEPVPYPMKVVVTVPEPGRLRHAWWYAHQPGEGAIERDVADLTRVT